MDDSLDHKSILLHRKKRRKKKKKFDLYCYEIFAIFLPFTMIDTQTHRQEYLLPEDLVICTHMDHRRKRKISFYFPFADTRR